jgi:hypothetical protein
MMKRVKTPENVSAARRMRLEGKSLKEIAHVFGVCKQAINLWLIDEEELKQRNKTQNAKRHHKISNSLYHAKRNARVRGWVPPDITHQQYELLLKNHDGKCEICGETPNRALHLDHCHVTGRVRGLLCGQCNTGIGLLKEDVLVLKSAIKYIQKK